MFSSSSFPSAARKTGLVIAGWTLSLQMAVAQIYQGGGPLSGVQATQGLNGIPQNDDPRQTITDILSAVLSYMALIAVAAVIVAGIYLIVGFGSDDSKEKAKKIIQYTLIGLAIILFSRIIVGLVTVFLASQVQN